VAGHGSDFDRFLKRNSMKSHAKYKLHRAVGLIAAGLISAGSCGSAWAGSAAYKYDTLGRLSTVTYSNGVTIVYTYDAAGNRLQEVTTGLKGGSGASTAALMAIIQLLLDD
jgi:YD repeat-containing protein